MEEKDEECMRYFNTRDVTTLHGITATVKYLSPTHIPYNPRFIFVDIYV